MLTVPLGSTYWTWLLKPYKDRAKRQWKLSNPLVFYMYNGRGWACLSLKQRNTYKGLFQWLAIQLWRGNVCMWVMRAPVMDLSMDGFYK